MPYVSIDQLKPGMVLATDVTDTNGRLLLSEGQSIARKHLSIFKMWGVPEVQVKHAGEGEPENNHTLNPEAMRRVAEMLKPTFADNDLTHPAVAEIFRQAVLYRSRHASSHHRLGRIEPVKRLPSPTTAWPVG